MTFRTCLGLSAVEVPSLRSSLYTAVVFLSLLSSRLEPPGVSQGTLIFACSQLNQCNPHPVGFIWHHLTSTWHCLSPCYLGYYWKRVCCKHIQTSPVAFSLPFTCPLIWKRCLKLIICYIWLLFIKILFFFPWATLVAFIKGSLNGFLVDEKRCWAHIWVPWVPRQLITSRVPQWALLSSCFKEEHWVEDTFLEWKDKTLWGPWGQLCLWHHYKLSF